MPPVIGALDRLLGEILYVCQRSLCFQQSKARIFLTNQALTTYKLLSNLASQETLVQRKPCEFVPELAARIRQAAATYDFTAVKDPLDEVLRTRFICAIKNEAVLKALFKVKDDESSFSRAVEIAIELRMQQRSPKRRFMIRNLHISFLK